MADMEASRRLVGVLAMSRDLLGGDMITAPAVEILFHLHATEKEGRLLDEDAITALLGIGAGTTVRWLAVLERRGLIEREVAHSSLPAASFRITQDAERALDHVLAALEV